MPFFWTKTLQQKNPCCAWMKSWPASCNLKPASCNLFLLSLYFHMCHPGIHPQSQGVSSLRVGRWETLSPIIIIFIISVSGILRTSWPCKWFLAQHSASNHHRLIINFIILWMGLLFSKTIILPNTCAGVETIGHKVPFKVHTPQCKMWPKICLKFGLLF